MLWSVRTHVSSGDNTVGYIDTARFGTLVITRSSMLLPRVGFFIELCQEVVVKGFNKGWLVNT